MIKQLRPALLILTLLTLLTGVIYPLVITGIAQLGFPDQANGSLVGNKDQPVGSKLLGQANDDPRYFRPRPSATDYGTLPSGAGNLAPTSLILAEQSARWTTDFRAAHGLPAGAIVPVEMRFASGSGLDPHISPDAARMQIDRVAAARGLKPEKVAALVEAHVEGPQFGLLGQPRVNVLLLNMALDRLQ